MEREWREWRESEASGERMERDWRGSGESVKRGERECREWRESKERVKRDFFCASHNLCSSSNFSIETQLQLKADF